MPVEEPVLTGQPLHLGSKFRMQRSAASLFKQVPLGQTGLKFSRVCMGTGMSGIWWEPRMPPATKWPMA